MRMAREKDPDGTFWTEQCQAEQCQAAIFKIKDVIKKKIEIKKEKRVRKTKQHSKIIKN